MTRALAIAAIAAVGCGDDAAPERSVTEVVADPQGRAVVARVDGRPVFASCVRTQAEAHGLDARAALGECIDFELLAQEAERRGYGGADEIAATQKREAVRALLERDFEARHADPSAIPIDEVREVFARPQVHVRYNHPEYRFAYFVRAQAEGQPQAVWDEAERRVRALYADLRGKRGLTRDDFWDAAERHSTDDFKFFVPPKQVNGPRTGRLDEAFARAMFSIPEVGMVSKPTKTPWGWDLLLLTRISERRRNRLEDVAGDIRRQMFPSWQRTRFLQWAGQLAANTRVHIEEDWESKLPDEQEYAP